MIACVSGPVANRDIQLRAEGEDASGWAYSGRNNTGTSFFRREAREGGIDEYHETHRVPFEPNTGYAFAVNESSWHGVTPPLPEGRPRNSLMLVYYKEGCQP